MLEIEIVEVSVTQMGFAIILKPPGREKVVPIFIGPLETYSISNALENQERERPLTHDLMKNILDGAHHKITRILVDDFRNGTFFAKLYIRDTKGNDIEIDARPSDAIAMAIRFNAPIFMSEYVYETTAINIEHIKDRIDKLASSDASDQILAELSNILNIGVVSDEEKKTNDILKSLIDDFSHTTKKKQIKLKRSNQKSKSKADVLKQMLKVAVKDENYEEAAKIRDELLLIKKIKTLNKKK